MSDEIATIGHNSGATRPLGELITAEAIRLDLVESASVIKFTKRAKELSEAFGRWTLKTANGIKTEELANTSTDFCKQLKKEAKAIEDHRKLVKRPYLDAQRTIDGFFNALESPLSAAAKKIEEALTKRLRDIAAENRRIAEAAAKAQREEAEAAAAAAARAGTVDMLDNAIAADQKAATAEHKAAAPSASFAQSRGDYGAMASLRKGPWQIAVTDLRAVPPEFLMINETAVRAHAGSLIAQGMKDPDVEFAVMGLRVWRDDLATVR